MTIKEFGDFLYLLRIEKGLPICKSSFEIGIDSNLLGRLERGNIRTFPRYKTLLNLSEYYNFRFQYIPSQLLVISIPSPGKVELELEEVAESDELEDFISMETGEKILIKRALKQSGYNRKHAAQILHIGERTLYRKLEEYKIETEVELEGINKGK